jgi:hypothetical protein
MSVPADLINDVFRAKVEQARRMTPEEKLLAGPRLFDRMCRVMRDGIRFQFPDASPEEVERILRERLEIARRLENRPYER